MRIKVQFPWHGSTKWIEDAEPAIDSTEDGADIMYVARDVHGEEHILCDLCADRCRHEQGSDVGPGCIEVDYITGYPLYDCDDEHCEFCGTELMAKA